MLLDFTNSFICWQTTLPTPWATSIVKLVEWLKWTMARMARVKSEMDAILPGTGGVLRNYWLLGGGSTVKQWECK